MFCVSCLGIWWRHDKWILEKLKFGYLRNKKSFRSEIKNIFLVSQVLSLRYVKQTSKHVGDTTFNDLFDVNNKPWKMCFVANNVHSTFHSGYLKTLSFEIFYEATAIQGPSNGKWACLTWAISIFNFFFTSICFSIVYICKRHAILEKTGVLRQAEIDLNK